MRGWVLTFAVCVVPLGAVLFLGQLALGVVLSYWPLVALGGLAWKVATKH